MKKAIALLMAALMTLGLCGCSLKDFTKTLTLTEPEEVTEAFFNGLKTKNEDALILYTANEDINMLLHSSGDKEDLNLIYDSLFKNFTYKIGAVKKNKDETAATVEVEVANSDFSKVLKKYQEKAYSYMEENLYSGKVNKKNLNAKCLSIFAEQVEKASKSEPGQAQKLTVKLTKNDNYSWDMELTEEMMKTIMGGLIIPL
ncbi:DUF5105 domain-containing protein [Anaerovorax odorimutans]|uniref:DUF5105 domain-containing protein n=1 Tax=Anaerovorax odorimutans TaxID=109327 RepID=A0ABT1RRG9_9FIRM|nr:DUF5105 domain-containing protein [Anaerovorax odorimutans]MCQ4637481.1 DUF5105 domain-containing protein [Anaerovorax odorimutans]